MLLWMEVSSLGKSFEWGHPQDPNRPALDEQKLVDIFEEFVQYAMLILETTGYCVVMHEVIFQKGSTVERIYVGKTDLVEELLDY